jgi:hypothetical protein
MNSLRRFVFPTLLLFCLSLLSVPPTHAQSDSVIPEAHLTFTTIDVPGAKVTEINGINAAGDMVGFYGQNDIGPNSGFLYSNGAFTYFDYPGQTVTVPGGINDSGLIVGYATQNADKRFKVVGFLYDGTTFTKLRDGNDTATYGFGINNAGIVVGRAGNLNVARAFQMRNNQYKTISFPGQYTSSDAVGINNLGQIAGFTSGGTLNGYLYKSGKFQPINFPGAVETAALGINDNGIVVGWYAISSGCVCGFATKNGKYISFSFPLANATFAIGINKFGRIVGAYVSGDQTYHGFVTSPITEADFERPGCCQVVAVETTQ